jgi:hypothetical protein
MKPYLAGLFLPFAPLSRLFLVTLCKFSAGLGLTLQKGAANAKFEAFAQDLISDSAKTAGTKSDRH